MPFGAYTKNMDKVTSTKLFKWNCILSLLAILIVSALQHFLYDLLPNVFVGIFAPRNESLAEHVKIVFYPVLLWWTITFLVFEKTKELNIIKWFSSASVAVLISISLVVLLFCTLFFGLWLPIDSFPIHITIEAVAIAISQTIGFHIYKRGRENKIALGILVVFVLAIAVLMAVFSYYPPHSPVFISP